ncbi:MAG: DEAD/DEAH box helicase family protein [bacterium]
MNKNANFIKQRLSLREPLKESLDIVAILTENLLLKKEVDLEVELEKVKNLYPSCTNFERQFPSICFSIATGVGKTRLMGACVAYLYLQKGIKNFFILAPNITIYEKLIRDFGDPGYQKYLFNGISEFVYNKPLVITGENYNQTGLLFKDSEVRINIFNVAKFNSENRGTRSGDNKLPPRIKRLSEYLGQSYWDYLSGLNDLVILMDEAHRYHADASKNAINELKPVLGIELTATPLDEKGNSFKNVVYEYSLAKALQDGKYVKNPAIATRKNFNVSLLTIEEIEKIKLEDAISVHQNTMNELELYSRNNNKKMVKPFILIVCRDINHAKDTYNYINSNSFFDGSFIGKVLQIDSSTKNEEAIERQFIELENYENDIEIVIHVNMLKEGWDVCNLYTIVPLRAANASILIEQTIGRGLRLPFGGERTGVDKVDKLTVIAHDNFEKVIEAAQDPNSVLNKMSFIRLEDEELNIKKEVVTSFSKVNNEINREEKRIELISNESEKQTAKNILDAKKSIIHILPTFNTNSNVKQINDLTKPEVKATVIAKITNQIKENNYLFVDEVINEVNAIYNDVVAAYKQNIIEIPRMDLVLGEAEIYIEDFELDISKGFDFTLLNEEIMVVELSGERRTENIGVIYGAQVNDNPLKQVLAEILNDPEIDYESNADLLHKLVKQTIDYINNKLLEKNKLWLLIRQYRKFIANRIVVQMKEHLHISEPEYIVEKVLPFVKIEDWNFSVIKNGRRDFKDEIKQKSLIPNLVFAGFKKACHFEYKFDSGTEKDFAYVLENDSSVIKWIRPAARQFNIYWNNNSKQYFPDFIVETEKIIYMVETKEEDKINSEEVQEKKHAALKYCQYATNFTANNNGKEWKYLLIPHTDVNKTKSFEYFVQNYKQ